MDVELAVIGGGPAGVAAAVAAAEAGVHVALIDEQGAPGGQIWRQPPPGITPPAALRPPAEAARLLERLESLTRNNRVTRWDRTLVWGHFGDGELGLLRDDDVYRMRTRRIVVATGAYDLPVPFPGWTLPGVMAAGGVQAFLKAQLLIPGRRILLVGAHPLLLVVAAQLVEAGAEVVAVAFAQSPGIAYVGRHRRDLWLQRERWPEGWAAVRTLRRAGVPILFGSMIARAEGDERVTRAVLTKVDDRWRPLPDAEQDVSCDVVAVGYGFIPATEFTRQAGCRHVWDETAGHWVCEQGPDLRSSIPHIFVAGEAAGIGGAPVAMLEGRLAGLTVAAELGYEIPALTDERDALYHQRQQARQTAQALHRLSAVQPGLFTLMDDDTIVCRCEEVTAGTLRQALRDHPHITSANALKLLTRCGMGPCQGRYCHGAAVRLIQEVRDVVPEHIGQFTGRAPVKPIALGALAAAYEREHTGVVS